MQEAAAEAARAVPVYTSVAVATDDDLGNVAATSSHSSPAQSQSGSPKRGLQQLYSAKEMNEGKIPEDGKAANSQDVDGPKASASSRQRQLDSILETDAPAMKTDVSIINAIMKREFSSVPW